MDSTFKIRKRIDYVGNFNYGFVTADNFTILRNEDGTWVMSVYDWVITKEPDPNYGKPTTLKFSPTFKCSLGKVLDLLCRQNERWIGIYHSRRPI